MISGALQNHTRILLARVSLVNVTLPHSHLMPHQLAHGNSEILIAVPVTRSSLQEIIVFPKPACQHGIVSVYRYIYGCGYQLTLVQGLEHLKNHYHKHNC